MADTEMNELEWYYERDEAPVGPLERRAFKRLIDDGVISDETLVWNESLEDWAPYAELKSDFEGGEVSHGRQERDAPAPTQPPAPRVKATEAASPVKEGGGEPSAPIQLEFTGESDGSQTAALIALSVFIFLTLAGLGVALVFVPGSPEMVEAVHSPRVDDEAVDETVSAIGETMSAIGRLLLNRAAPKSAGQRTQPVSDRAQGTQRTPKKLAAGSACKFRLDCQSNKCASGRCTDGEIGDSCAYDHHCKGGRCVKRRCIEGNVGDPCKFTHHCKHKKCVQGRCIAGVSGDPCRFETQCKSRRCEDRRCE